MKKPLTRRQRIAKARPGLDFHRKLALMLATARRNGSVITTKFVRARLLVNAQALRHKLLDDYQYQPITRTTR